MRIRSIKPEFYRSDDIDALDWHDRLLFIAMWSYVDDNGVGRDKVASIAADLFAGDLSVDPTETLRRVSLGLERLEQAGLITRYRVAGRAYLYIVAWDKHQLIKNPSKPRFPAPTCDSSDSTESLPQASVDPTESLPTGTGEQGISRTEEQRVPPTAGADAPTAQTLVAEWIDHCGEKPPSRVVGQVAKELGAMLTEGIAYDRVRTGLAEWQRKGLHPSALASVVHESSTRVARSTTNERVGDALALAERFEQEESA